MNESQGLGHDVEEWNVSSRNVSTLPTSTPESAAQALILNIIIPVISSANILLTIIAVITLFRCKRMSLQIKRLSYNVFLTDLLLNAILVFMSVFGLIYGKAALDSIKEIRAVVVMTTTLVSLASIAGLTLDRLLAVTKPMQYTKILTKRGVTVLTLYIWLVNTVLPTTVFVVPSTTIGNFDFQSPHREQMLLPVRLLFVLFYIVYHSFISLAYFKIIKVTRSQVRTIAQLTHAAAREYRRNYLASSNTISKIVLSFELTNLPILIQVCSFWLYPYLQDGKESFIRFGHMLVFLCTSVNLYMCFYMYVWVMKECKLVFLSTFMGWNRNSRNVAARLKMEVFNIVTYGGHDIAHERG